MTKERTKKLVHGVYRIYWRRGGTSLAAVGSMHDGTKWMAQTNGTSLDNDQPLVATTKYWHRVSRAELLERQ